MVNAVSDIVDAGNRDDFETRDDVSEKSKNRWPRPQAERERPPF